MTDSPVWVTEVRRRDDGVPLRDLMRHRGFTIKGLAAATAEIDGKGVNWRTIGFLTSQWNSGRETTTYRNAALLAAALGVDVAELFDVTTQAPFTMPTTSTQRESNADREAS